jgi:general secretion pathway protein B
MSLILDALNRSETEQASGGEVPGLATRHYADGDDGEASWRSRFILLAVVLGLLVLLGAWIFLAEKSTMEPPPVATLSPEVAPVVAPSPPPATKPSAVQAEPVVVFAPVAKSAPRPDVAALYQTQPQKFSANDSSRSQEAPVESVQPVAQEETVAQREQLIDLEKMIELAEREIDNQSLAEHSAPMLDALSQQRKDAIPTLMYSRHDYREDSAASTIIINGKTLRSGDSAASGITLEEILPDSAVFSLRGELFRLGALSSWVNL